MGGINHKKDIFTAMTKHPMVLMNQTNEVFMPKSVIVIAEYNIVE